MSSKPSTSEAHKTAPEVVKRLQKYYQKLPAHLVEQDGYVLDLHNGAPATGWHANKLQRSSSSSLIKEELLQRTWEQFLQQTGMGGEVAGINPHELEDGGKIVYEHVSIPGLKIIPSLLPVPIQETLLDRILLRDLSDPRHRTNLHLHYDIPYPSSSDESLFHLPPSSTYLTPYDTQLHKPLSLQSALSKKLRWMTLGGQYNWTDKVYPTNTTPIPFPADIGKVVNDVFGVEAQAAIFNVYNCGDTLSPHRDVSEESSADLVSVSIGCDALFLISVAPEEGEEEEKKKVEEGESIKATTVSSEASTGVAEAIGGIGGQQQQQQQQKRNRKKNQSQMPEIQHPGRDADTLVVRLRSGDAVVMGGESRWAWHGVPKIFDTGCPDELRRWPMKRNGGDIKDEENTGANKEGDYHGNNGLIEWEGWLKGKRINLNIRQMYD